jgi:mannitol/fructose-specific phosphotransferase system IIA component (Ntr-type)
MAASRAPLAMSRDGLMPGCLARLHPRRETPAVSIGVTAAIIAAAVLFLSVEDLVKTASAMMLLLFMLDNAAVIIMRQSGLTNYRPLFRARGYPYLYLGALAAYAFLVFEMGRTAMLLTLGFVLLSLFWFALRVLPRVKRESAFRFMIRRLLDPDTERAELDNELAGIVLERDEVRFDRLDRIIEQCLVLDVEQEIDRAGLFDTVAERLAEGGAGAAAMARAFEAREQASSTVLRRGLAFPHIIVPGRGVFQMALVRARHGIAYDPDAEPVYAAFFFVASEDQRNFYLRALMTVAQVVQHPDFEQRWRKAGGEQGLREVILFARAGR